MSTRREDRRVRNTVSDDVGVLVAAVLTDRRYKGATWRYDPTREECRVVADDDVHGAAWTGMDHIYAVGVCIDLMAEPAQG